ncbi:MAG TPA: AAA family ATPase, partial [Nevskiaceae bacterium]|nr:AAA family ATPase [Nevskiaceae bacterium]
MLEHLQVRNLATIEDLSIDLGRGFTALTGETGAGKSILIDALGLVLGTRGDAGLVRGGAKAAEIVATFRLADAPQASAFLRAQELLDPDDPDSCVVRRVVQADAARTRAFVNGTPVPAANLRELGEHLVDVFGQNESQGLRAAEVQRELLDAFGAHADELAAVAACAREHRRIAAEIERVRAAGRRDPAQVDFLRHQVREIEALNLADGEL